MSEPKENKAQDARTQRRAEALRRNLRRRKLQARGRAAAERPDEGAAADEAKQRP
jgi:hypothetical protein